MRAQIIDGNNIGLEVRANLSKRVAALKAQGITPGLTVILVGEDAASKVYVANKEKAAATLGIAGKVLHLPENTTEESLIAQIEKLNADETVHGILVQLPLPKHMDTQKVLMKIRPEKDVDGFHIINAGLLMTGNKGILPCTPKGIMHLIKTTGRNIAGCHAVVIGRSNIVGKPIAMLLLQENATVTICHSRTENLAEITRQADILVAAVGKARMVTGDMIKPGAIVIDVGMNRENGKLCGDVDYTSACEIADYITPVPGGVGPMTIAMLMENTVEVVEAVNG